MINIPLACNVMFIPWTTLILSCYERIRAMAGARLFYEHLDCLSACMFACSTLICMHCSSSRDVSAGLQHQSTRQQPCTLHLLRRTKVNEKNILDVTARIFHHAEVVRFHIAVHYAKLVHLLEPVHHQAAQLAPFLYAKPTAAHLTKLETHPLHTSTILNDFV